jgi:glycosyltransferase involved in cell wall biosynthesis
VHVLILNWRDIRSPRAGGAEVLTHEVAGGLAAIGASVTLFTSRPDGLAEREEIDGVQVVRRGSELTTRLHAPSFARAKCWDVVVEEINTLPYFAPIWNRGRTLLFMPQLAREVWWYEAPGPTAAIGYTIEPAYLALYRKTEAITISRSTATDLRSIGLQAPVHVLPMATGEPALGVLEAKAPRPDLIVVGRLVPSKRVDHALAALAELQMTHPDATLTIVGDGPQRSRLEEVARRLGIDAAVVFVGTVSQEQKSNLYRGASILVGCAVREGWGLTVTEAARLGTPAVAYDVPGFRDSIVPGRTGLLTDPQPEALAAAVSSLVDDPARYASLRRSAWEQTRGSTWRSTRNAFAEIVFRSPPAQLSGVRSNS